MRSAHEALAAVYCLEPHACRSAPTHTNARSDFKLQLLDVCVGLDAMSVMGIVLNEHNSNSELKTKRTYLVHSCKHKALSSKLLPEPHGTAHVIIIRL